MKTFYTLFNKRNVLKVTFLAALGWLGTANLQAQISGAYTIDQTGTASATVYEDFQSVIDDLSGNTRSDGGVANNTGSGVTGNAVFTVAAGSGPYNWTSTDHLTIPAIASMSSAATVTFKGNNEVINYTGTTALREAILMDGADWFRFDSLEIYNTRTTQAWCIRFQNNADNNIIENCVVRTSNITGATTSTTSGSCPIVFGSAANTLNASQWGTSAQGSNGNNNIIRNNSIGGRDNGTSAGAGPMHGIFMVGEDGDGTDGNEIRDNYISNTYYRTILMQDCDNNTIDGNEITSPETSINNDWGTAAIYVDNWNSAADQPNTFTKNKIHDNLGTGAARRDYWGIYIYDQGDGAADISNNVIYDLSASSNLYGINLGNSTVNNGRLNCYHNTIDFSSIGTSSPIVYGIYSAVRAANADIKNNNVNITSMGGSATQARYAFFDRQWGSATWDYNNGFVDRSGTGNPTTGDNYGSLAGAGTSFSAWQTSGRGTNSTTHNPNFLDPSTCDFRSLSFPLNNTGTNLGIIDDINDSTRSVATPDKGAFEVKIDASITAFPWTDFAVCGNFEDSVRITIRNENTFAIRDIPVSFTINSTVVEEVITATVAAGATANYTFAQTAVFNTPGVNSFSAGVGVADDNAANNLITYSVTVTSAPSGSELVCNNVPGLNEPQHNVNGIDVTVPGAVLDYTFSKPVANNSSMYTNNPADWTASSVLRTKAGQTVVTGNTDASTATTLGVLVDVPMAYTDTMLELAVTFVDVLSGCDTTYFKDILVAPRGVPAFSFPPTVCNGEGVLFDNLSTVSSGFLEYKWSFIDPANPTPTPDSAENTNPVYTFPASGTYTVRLITVTNPYGFQDTVEKTVTVTPIPTVSFTRVNKCEGENVILTNTTSPLVGPNYTWDFGDGSATVSTQDASKAYVPGGYPVTLTAEQNGCAASLTKNVYQFARPVANATLVSGSCSNEAFKFDNTTTISVGNTGYLWNFDEPSAISTDKDPSYTFQTPGTKMVRLRSVSEFGCEDTLNMPLMVTVKEAPKAQFTFETDAVAGVACSQTPTNFTNTSTTPVAATNNYTWTLEGTTAVNNNTTFAHPWATLGKKIVMLRADANNGCTDILTQEIDVLVQPIADFVLADVCEGETVQLTNLTTWPAGDISYNWNIPIASPAVSTDGAPTVTITAAPSNQTVTLVATIAGGCSSTKNIQIEVKEKPATCDFDITPDFVNGIRNFDLTPTGGSMAGITYQWSTPEGNSQTTGMAKEDVTFPDGTGLVTITMNANNNGCGCSSTKTFQLTSVEALANGGTFKLFPNPTKGKLNVEITDNNEDLVIEVFNAVGVQVATVNTNNAKNGTFKADLSELSSGLYLVRVKTGSQTTTQRITLTK